MKKNIIIAAIAATSALLLCASCQKQELIEQNEIYPEGKVFTATIENLTKTTITGDYKVNWVDGDKVSINGDDYVATADASDPTKATLAPTGAQPVGKEDGYYYALYPASLCDENEQGELYFELPATQTYSAGEFNAPMYAVSETEDFKFNNICGVLCLSLKGTDKVKSISVTANEAICGVFTMTDATTVNLTGEGKKVTLDCGAEGVQLNETTATNFYIYLPPKDSYSAGMNIVVISTDGKVFQKTTTKAVKIEKNNIYTFDWIVVAEAITLAQILATNPDLPKSDDDVTPPANAWINSTDPACRAFEGKNEQGRSCLVVTNGNYVSTLDADEELDMIDENTFQVEYPSSRYEFKMTEGKFTSFEYYDTDEEFKALNGTYAAPICELVLGDYTITDEISLDGRTSEQTFTVISKDGTDSNISIKNLAYNDDIEWYATYDKSANTLTLDGRAYGYRGNKFMSSLYYLGNYTVGYRAGDTFYGPIVFSVDSTTHQICGLQADYALAALQNDIEIFGYFQYFAAGVATIVKVEQ